MNAGKSVNFLHFNAQKPSLLQRIEANYLLRLAILFTKYLKFAWILFQTIRYT